MSTTSARLQSLVLLVPALWSLWPWGRACTQRALGWLKKLKRRQQHNNKLAFEKDSRDAYPKDLQAVVAHCEARWILEGLQEALVERKPGAIKRVHHMLEAGFGAKQSPEVLSAWVEQAWGICSSRESAPAHTLLTAMNQHTSCYQQQAVLASTLVTQVPGAAGRLLQQAGTAAAQQDASSQSAHQTDSHAQTASHTGHWVQYSSTDDDSAAAGATWAADTWGSTTSLLDSCQTEGGVGAGLSGVQEGCAADCGGASSRAGGLDASALVALIGASFQVDGVGQESSAGWDDDDPPPDDPDDETDDDDEDDDDDCR